MVGLLTLAYCESLRENWLLKLVGAGIPVLEIIAADKDTLLSWGVPLEIATNFLREKQSINETEKKSGLNKLDIQFLTPADKSWPKILNNLNHAPLWLFARGQAEILTAENIIGFVGTRKLSPYGQQISKNIADWLTAGGATLVSGLAFGADAIAHRAACSKRLPNIAVLASGVDEGTLYPQSHVSLARQILACGGAIISEWPPFFKPKSYHFPYRNRLIAGLAQAVVITEAPIKSGTIHTAKWALELGTPIGAVPGDINRPSATGTNYLISNGATALCTKEDVLHFAGLAEATPEQRETLADDSSALAKNIWQELAEPKNFDQLCQKIDATPSDLLVALTELEINNKIYQNPNNDYARN